MRRGMLMYFPHKYMFPPFLLSPDTGCTGYQVNVIRLALKQNKPYHLLRSLFSSSLPVYTSVVYSKLSHITLMSTLLFRLQLPFSFAEPFEPGLPVPEQSTARA